MPLWSSSWDLFLMGLRDSGAHGEAPRQRMCRAPRTLMGVAGEWEALCSADSRSPAKRIDSQLLPY